MSWRRYARLLSGLLGVLSTFGVSRAPAQGASQDASRGCTRDGNDCSTHSAHRWNRSVWFASALRPTVATRLGTTPFGLYEAGVRLSRKILGSDVFAVSYVGDLVPLALASNMSVGYNTEPCVQGGVAICTVAVRRTAAATGVRPLGIDMLLRRTGSVTVRALATAGFLQFDYAVPDPEARKLNFTASGGLESAWDAGDRLRFELDLIREHISNGATGRANPGLNATMLVLGFGIFEL